SVIAFSLRFSSVLGYSLRSAAAMAVRSAVAWLTPTPGFNLPLTLSHALSRFVYGEGLHATRCTFNEARSAVRFVYQLNLPAGQSTAVDMLRRCHADACDLHARPGRNGRAKILIFTSLAGC